MKYKKHMILLAERGEGFSTVCGINDASTPQFQESAELVDFGDTEKTNCKRCLQGFEKMVTDHDRQVAKTTNSKP